MQARTVFSKFKEVVVKALIDLLAKLCVGTLINIINIKVF